MSAPLQDGWIEHDGGGCPVSAGTEVEIESEDGYRASGPARYFSNADGVGEDWWVRHSDRIDALGRARRHPDDIIAYRVVKP